MAVQLRPEGRQACGARQTGEPPSVEKHRPEQQSLDALQVWSFARQSMPPSIEPASTGIPPSVTDMPASMSGSRGSWQTCALPALAEHTEPAQQPWLPASGPTEQVEPKPTHIGAVAHTKFEPPSGLGMQGDLSQH